MAKKLKHRKRQGLLDETIEALMKEEYFQPTAFQTEAQIRTKTTQEIKEAVNQILDDDPFERCWATIKEELPSHYSPEVIATLTHTLSEALQKAQQPNHLLQEQTLQEQLGLGEETLKYFYDMGYALYSHAEFAKAADVFEFLCLMNSFQYNYLFSYGSALIGLEKWHDALVVLGMSSLLEPSDPNPHLWSAFCHIKLGDHANAKLNLEEAAPLISKSPLKEQQEKQLDQLNKLIDVTQNHH